LSNIFIYSAVSGNIRSLTFYCR